MSNLGSCLLNHVLVDLEPVDGGSALAWLRRARGLVGTKEGCGEGECGACAVLLGEPAADGRVAYRAVASCLLPLAELSGRHVVTVEGLNPQHGQTPVQRALVDAGAPQCGFCFPGLVMSLTGFLLTAEAITPDDAATAIDGNICRCTGYASIRRAAADLCAEATARLAGDDERVDALVAWGVLPSWFRSAGRSLGDPTRTPAIPVEHAGGVLLAGGTDLIIQRPELLDADGARHLSRRTDLQTIVVDADHVEVGGGVPVADLDQSADLLRLVPALPEFVRRFASTLIRNRATVAGNLVNASPIGDLSVLLLALGAHLVLERGDQRRTLPLARFFRAYRQVALREGEVVAAVRIPTSVARDAVAFEKVSQRHILDIASVNSALRVRFDQGTVRDATLAVGGVAPVPMIARAASGALVGRPLDAQALSEAGRALVAEIAPIDDVRGSAAYKRELARRLLLAHGLELAPDQVNFEELA